VICAAWFASLRTPGSYAWPDSGIYVDGARHLAAGQGFSTSLVSIGEESPRAVAIFPPGFPALVAVGIRVGLPPRESASLVLSIAYAGYTLAAYVLVLLAAGRRWWPLAAGVALFLALQPLVLHAMESVLSDLPFASCTTAAAALAVLVAARPRPSRVALAVLGALLALAVFVRWAGFFTLLGITLGVLVGAGSSWTPAERVRRVAWIAVGPLALLGALCLRNFVTTGTLLGHRVFALAPLLETLGAAGQGLGAGFAGVFPRVFRLVTGIIGLWLGDHDADGRQGTLETRVLDEGVDPRLLEDAGEQLQVEHEKQEDDRNDQNEQPQMTLAEVRLLKAEGLYRMGDPAGAAAIVNETRTAAGLNPTDASGTKTIDDSRISRR